MYAMIMITSLYCCHK